MAATWFCRVGWALVAMVVAVARSAEAQDEPRFDVSGGYQYIIDVSDYADLTRYPKGVFASAGWNATDWLGMVGEFTLGTTTIEVGDSARFGPIDSTVYTTMGGVRFHLGGVFVQALLGQLAVRTRKELLFGALDETVTGLAVQPGLGFDFAHVGRFSGRFLVDYRALLSDESTFGYQIRVAAGVVVGLGRR